MEDPRKPCEHWGGRFAVRAGSEYSFYQGGNKANPDTFRGYLNEDGIYPVRIGAHLPGFDDSAWESADRLFVSGAGIIFFRTPFTLVSVI